MSIPESLKRSGYISLQELGAKRRVMIGTEGETNTGKSEFIFSAPGPVGVLCLDRNLDGVAHNTTPPTSRREDIAIKMVCLQGNYGNRIADTKLTNSFLEDWQAYRREYKELLANADTVTAGFDGDSDSWELQRLAEFGKLTQIPSILYDSVNAGRRSMIREAYDSGKNIISTNKVTDIYVDKIGVDGRVEMSTSGKAVQVKSGQLRRQGFADYKYLWQIQIRHLRRDPIFNSTLKRIIPGAFGLRILECKSRMEIKGEELWGDNCNFRGLVELVYPDVDPEEWFQ